MSHGMGGNASRALSSSRRRRQCCSIRRQSQRRAEGGLRTPVGAWRRDYPKWIADNVAPFFIPETSPAMMTWGASLLQSSLPVVLACSRAMVQADFRAEMRSIDLPTLIIHGDRDRSAPIELTGKPSADLVPLRAPHLSGRATRSHVHSHGAAQCRHPAVYARELSRDFPIDQRIARSLVV